MNGIITIPLDNYIQHKLIDDRNSLAFKILCSYISTGKYTLYEISEYDIIGAYNVVDQFIKFSKYNLD